mgnify:CR=1 FL=1
MIPKAMPGRATCERASERSVIFRKTKKEPISPLAAATKIPEIKVKIDIPLIMMMFEKGVVAVEFGKSLVR